jgi:hypothetical protein
MNAFLLHQSHGGGLSWLNLAHKWVQTKPLHNYVSALDNNHFRLAYTSMVYIYIMFKHLKMQWKGIWMHLYLIRAMEVG